MTPTEIAAALIASTIGAGEYTGATEKDLIEGVALEVGRCYDRVREAVASIVAEAATASEAECETLFAELRAAIADRNYARGVADQLRFRRGPAGSGHVTAAELRANRAAKRLWTEQQEWIAARFRCLEDALGDALTTATKVVVAADDAV